MSGKYLAFVDETGSAGGTDEGNRFFGLGATVIHESAKEPVHSLLEEIRRTTGRRSGDVLHFKNLKVRKDHRMEAASRLNSNWLLHAVSISDKSAHGMNAGWTHDDTYYWVITMLMERLSWMAQTWSGEMEVILAHKRHMTVEKLSWHENRLRNGGGAQVGNRIDWSRISSKLKFDTPQANEFLQLSDMFASSVGAAINGEGNSSVINTNYVRAFAPRLYRGPSKKLNVYGFKVHPTSSCPSWISQI